MDVMVWLRSLGLDEASGVESEAGIAAAVVNVPVLVTPRLAAATTKATPAAWRCSRRCAKFRLVYRCSLRFAARHNWPFVGKPPLTEPSQNLRTSRLEVGLKKEGGTLVVPRRICGG